MANGGALAVAESDDDPGRALGLPGTTATAAPDTSRKLGIADLVDPKATEDLKKIAGETAAEDKKVIDAQNTLVRQDQARLRQQYEATGINPGEFRPWNADVEMSKYRTEPLAAFASLGSVLGILASSFTHAPLQNALNASAAAMTAMHEGDEKAYEKAHTAWKENTELVFKRHELEQQRFNDALSLMRTDMSVGEAQLRNNLIMSGDKKALAMLNAGMFQELIDYKAKEADTVLKSRIAVDEINKLGISQAWENAMIKQIPDEVKKDPLHYSAALQNIMMTSQMMNSKDIDKQALGNWQAQYLKEHDFQPPSTEEFAAKLREMSEAKQRHTMTPDEQQYALIAEKYKDDPDKINKISEAYEKYKRGQRSATGTRLTPNQEQYELIKEKYKDDPDRAEKIKKEYGEFIREQHAPTGQAAAAKAAQAAEQRKAVVDDYLTDIDTALQRIANMKKTGWGPQVGSAAGLTKLLETATGRTQVADLQRNLAQLKEHYKEVFSGKGRTLAAEFKELDAIIPGEIQGFNVSLSRGFTWPRFDRLVNVEHALVDLRERMQKRYNDLIQVDTPEPLSGGLGSLSDADLRRMMQERGIDPDNLPPPSEP